MKAAWWMGTHNVEVGVVPKPTITDPHDAIIQISHCTISGSDIQLYEGELNESMEKGDILGQEAIGLVEDVGAKVQTLKPGDRVIILPVISCGSCNDCQKKQYSLCGNTNPSRDMEAAYRHRISGRLGYSRFCGGYPGDQAEYCRVPNADLTCIRAPRGIDARKLLGLSNVATTAWHALELAEGREGDVVAVWGCGPVGLAVQRLAKLRGAKKVYAMDRDSQRLRIAEDFGMMPVDVSLHQEVGAYLLSIQEDGLDRAIEAMCRSLDMLLCGLFGLERDSGDTLEDIIRATRKGGHVALVGDSFFTTHDFPIGPMMQKALTVRGGQVCPQKYYPFLLDLVVQGKIDPS
ncbi:Branched-chain amino acid aminotransferase II [Penicillium nucicola]|uniref:Branched-chain amino acid aminotransferase II n=1 Tax=Penicillium nucicola TaxID=1850975 RepID=UPI0025455911|nr:Branched-chain amino acid aminotransferase II [Penicillium nucicola]KAJ5754111.1 Branched-chain amino acid aminotransferase II [Penicillium nucicola]